MNYQEKVKEFQIKGGEDFSKGLTPLREALLKEEIAELEQAIKDNNRVEVLDALCDIKYVNDGNANILGVEGKDYYYESIFGCYYMHHSSAKEKTNDIVNIIKQLTFEKVDLFNNYTYQLSCLFGFTLENFKTALDRVHDSNMSKFCNSESEAIESVKAYEEKGIETYYKNNVIYRKSDNKILKSKYYHAVELSDLVQLKEAE